MRKYSSITPKFWIGKTGRKLRCDISAKLVAAYLLSCPNNDMTGVFYCPLCQISAETGLPLEAPSVPLPSPFQGPLKGIREALETLQREDFAIYDYESEYVFVKKMALFQIAPELKPTDKRVTGIRTAIESMPDNFKYLFIKEYNECFNLGFKNIPSPEIQEFGVQTQEGDDLPSSPIEAPSKALRSQEQEQEQEQETYTRTEKNEKQSELAENFAGRECEKPVSLKTEAIEEELPLEEQEASVSKKEIVEPKPKKEVKTQRLQKPEELTDEFWQDFLAYRKQKKAPVTERVVSLLRKEAKTAGWKLEEVINEMMVRNWTGFKADWVKDDWKDPNAHWVSAAEYNKELPPVTYSTGAKNKFVEKLHAGMRAYDIKDLPNNEEQR
ncbi:hypothetical protein [Parasutterella sp.]|jgi:hypothetical protein|uniref:hypothetical protein n=1 Tax=Parasutterella sp. TaxID=2049037 RepID=UPI002054382C|nr:MAG TPA: hypothetical protein [Caudoviricetes sp.]DAY79515.1 MAG TPA: hypothetical protein [Caudoviricetes sp.]